jgi:hypothetical protein
MAFLYLSAVSFIKERVFPVRVPAFYFPSLPNEVMDNTPKPLERPNPFKKVSVVRHQPQYMRPMADPDALQEANFTTEILLDMFRKKIDFEFMVEEDVVELFEGLDRYLISLKPDVELGDEKVTNYAQLVIDFREKLYGLYYRYMKLNPAAFEKLYPNNKPKENLMYLMMHGSGTNVNLEELDPLLAKRRPPYVINKIKPICKDTSVNEEIKIESYLGPSSGANFEDANDDFNFDDFLKKS